MINPVLKFDERYGLKGTTYNALMNDKKMYVGTENGLYCTNWDISPSFNLKFKPVGDPENIWQIDTIGNELFIGGNTGLYILKNGKLGKNILNKSIPVWRFERLEKNQDKLLIGTNKGFCIIEHKNGKWELRNEIKGFNKRCRHFEQDTYGNIWYTEKDSGIQVIKLNNSLDSIENIKYFHKINGPTNKEYYIFRIYNEIVIGTNQGLFKYVNKNNSFYPLEKLNQFFKNGMVITLFKDINQVFWLKAMTLSGELQEYNLFRIRKSSNDQFVCEKDLFNQLKNSIQSIVELNDSLILMGQDKGFVLFNNNFESSKLKPSKALIRKLEQVLNQDSSNVLFYGSYGSVKTEDQIDPYSQVKLTLSYQNNSVRFLFASLDFFHPEQVEFSCLLDGNDKTWSKWSKDNFREYSNLREGEYTFRVKSRNIYGLESEPDEYSFIIESPWYRTIYAYISYGVLAIIVFLLALKINARKIKEQKKKLEKIVDERTVEVRQKNEEIKSQNEELFTQNEALNRLNSEIQLHREEIISSINYAKRIQHAILPSDELIKEVLPEHFILYKPKDIVSGDFYWIKQIKNHIIVAVGDCTGHGVPGAMMSMLGSSYLSEIVTNRSMDSAGEILDRLRAKIKKSLHQEGKEGEQKDGMDISFFIIDKETLELQYSGAFNPLYIVRKDGKILDDPNNQLHVFTINDQLQLIQLKADRQPIAIHFHERAFQTHHFKLQKDDCIYAFSDGYPDQFGGNNGQKFMNRKFKELVATISEKPINEQREILDQTFNEWKGNYHQVDDVLVMGIRI